jgi:biopolymer transport protein ExbB/TolQ
MLWMTVIGWLARVVLVLLVGLSVWSISIIIERRRYFKNLNIPLDDYRKALKAKKSLPVESNMGSQMFQEISSLKSTEQIEKAFDVFMGDKKKEMEQGLPVLGTLGSTSPFIGLLGTILGIIVSFGELSLGTGSTNTVMFSLAEALILTAVGLIVAIPAVIGFNVLSRKSRGIMNEVASLKDLYIAYRD